MMAFRAARSWALPKMTAASLARSSRPSGPIASGKRPWMSRNAGEPGTTTSRAISSASITAVPKSRNIALTALLPVAIPPVSPMIRISVLPHRTVQGLSFRCLGLLKNEGLDRLSVLVPKDGQSELGVEKIGLKFIGELLDVAGRGGRACGGEPRAIRSIGSLNRLAVHHRAWENVDPLDQLAAVVDLELGLGRPLDRPGTHVGKDLFALHHHCLRWLAEFLRHLVATRHAWLDAVPG